jgi:riboflavin kinase/FMN adenylyltransferase
MRIVRDYQFTRPEDRGASVAIGNFDGVHRGHSHVIGLARRPEAPLGVVTFEPHPREFFAPDAPPFRLMNAEARAHRLKKLGVEILAELPFDTTLSSLTAESFARDVLADGLGVSHVVVGADFCFGKGRTGTAEMLSDFGREMGFDVTIAPLLSGESGAGPLAPDRGSRAAR